MASASGSKNSRNAADAADVSEHLRAAGEAAADAARARAEAAREWARDRWTGIQEAVEEQPIKSTVYALGIGVAAGLLIATLFHSRR